LSARRLCFPGMATGSHERIQAELRLVRQQERVHGAYLFEGPPGSGVRDTAIWFARLLLCRADGSDPCELCRDCRKTTLGAPDDAAVPQHPDLKRVEPDGAFIKVEQIRVLRRDLGLVANEGGWRVGLILGAETLRIEAANALLKTLEEPRPRTTLLLVAGQAARLPLTLRSRSVHLRFTPEFETTIEAALLARGLPEKDAWLAAALGGGSVASAQAWLEERLDAAREMVGVFEQAPELSVSELLDFAEAFRGNDPATRERVELLFQVHAAFARRAIDAALGQASRPQLGQWLDRAETGQHAHREWIRRNLNSQLLVEGLLLELQSSG